MDNYEYDLTVTLHTDMPTDVLIEHIGYALRGIVNPQKHKGPRNYVDVMVNSVRKPRQHPFEGPEVNEDFQPGGVLPGATTWETLVHGEPVIAAKDLPQVDMTIFSGKRDDGYDTNIRAYPIPEPEVEVVEVDLDEILGAVYTAIGEDFPYLAELFNAKRDEHVARSREITDPPAEGDWQLDDGDNVGDDID